MASTGGLSLRSPGTKGHRPLQLYGKRVEFTITEPWPREIDGDLLEPGTYMGFTVLPAAINIGIK